MLSRVEFYNYCQFSEAAFDFTPGVNIIVGPNGSGKSTIMNGIYGIITGDWSRSSSAGKQKNEENIFWHAGKDDRAGGRLTLSNQWVMERNIRPNSRKLIIPGVEKPITKDGDIDSRFFDLFGMSPQVIRDFVLVAQEGVKDILTITPQERLKMLIKAFQLERFEEIYEALDKESSSDRTILSEVRPDISGLQAQYEKTKADLEQFRSLPPVQIPAVNPDALSKVIFGYNSRDTVGNRVTQFRAELDSCQNALTTITKVVADMEVEVRGVEEYLRTNKPEIDQFAASIASHDKAKLLFDAIAGDKRSLNIEEEHFRNLMSSTPLPMAGPTKAELEAQLATARTSVTELYGAAKLSQDIRKLGSTVCPTCRQAIAGVINPDAEKKYADAQDLVKRLEYSINDHLLHEKKVSRHKEDIGASEGKQRMFRERIAANEQIIQQHGLAVLKEETLNAFKNAVDVFRRVEFGLQSKQTTLQVAINGKNKESEGVNEAHQRWAAALEEFRTLPTAAQATNAEAELNSYRRAQEEDIRRKEAGAHIERAFNDADQALKQAQEYLDSRARRQVWVERSTVLREAFHRNNVPRRVLAKKLQGLEAATVDFLNNFAVPFVPSFTDDTDIICKFHDGKSMPVARLSPGQKVALALSYRLAQHKVIAPRVDFIGLDEPADGLDKNNRQRLNLMLPTLRQISQQSNVQFILITHDEIPEGIVDNVIRLREQV